MTILYSDPLFLEHKTGDHPEQPARLVGILRHLKSSGLWGRSIHPQWDPADEVALERVHDAGYLALLRRYADRGGGPMEVDTVVSARSFAAARLAAGAVCDAVRSVVGGDDRNALCLVRPPGHHALRDAPMGFCLLNNIAIGAEFALAETGLDRVLIVDWDVHHGNGTQDAFWTSDRVGFLSIHRWPFYPGSGQADEIGAGPGLGYTCNIPVPFGISREDYLRRFTEKLQVFADKVRPELVLISAGFDSHRLDPIGSLGLEVADFARLTDIVQGVADAHAGGRMVSTLEGGYNLDILPLCVAGHLERLLAASAGSPTSTAAE